MSMKIPSIKEIENRIIATASIYVGVREVGGFNKGPDVEMFQKFVDGKAEGESWCMSFVQFVVGQVCKHYGIQTVLYPSENCQQVYTGALSFHRATIPGPGFVFIQQSRKTAWKGHTGICTGGSVGGVFPSIEGNTNGAGAREGDGVYKKYRYTMGNTSSKMRGFLNVPRMIQDAIELKYG